MPLPDTEPLSLSLVICTMGRQAEVERCVDAILAQNYRKLQVILVDQSGDDRMVPLVERLKTGSDAIHVRSGRLGASAARNLGARHATGEVISFPDDDCWYTPGLLTMVNEMLVRNPDFDGVTGRTVSADGSGGNGRFNTSAQWVRRSNVWTTSIEFTIFLRRAVWQAVGEFNESIGTGARTPFQAGEGTDYVIRAIDRGYRIWFTPELTVGHPLPKIHPAIVKKAYYYGVGMGYLARTHRLPLKQTVSLLVRPALGAAAMLLSARFGAARYHASVGLGRSMGYFRGASFLEASATSGS